MSAIIEFTPVCNVKNYLLWLKFWEGSTLEGHSSLESLLTWLSSTALQPLTQLVTSAFLGYCVIVSCRIFQCGVWAL